MCHIQEFLCPIARARSSGGNLGTLLSTTDSETGAGVRGSVLEQAPQAVVKHTEVREPLHLCTTKQALRGSEGNCYLQNTQLTL